jgi:hypothetical protein
MVAIAQHATGCMWRCAGCCTWCVRMAAICTLHRWDALLEVVGQRISQSFSAYFIFSCCPKHETKHSRCITRGLWGWEAVRRAQYITLHPLVC